MLKSTKLFIVVALVAGFAHGGADATAVCPVRSDVVGDVAVLDDAWSQDDSCLPPGAPDERCPAADVVGAACGTPSPQACPVAADERGDAGPIMRVDGTALPGGQPALDVLAVGADVAPAALAISVRLADPAAPPPPGYDTLVWTASWAREGGGRWFAQAVRTSDGVVYTAGADETASSSYPVAAEDRGERISGAFDPRSGLVSMMVPREIVGDPANGATLGRFAAAATATSSSGVFTIVDETPLASYLVGAPCGA